jgi:hypothetical protein
LVEVAVFGARERGGVSVELARLQVEEDEDVPGTEVEVGNQFVVAVPSHPWVSLKGEKG